MRVCVVSPFEKASKEEILSFLSKATSDLVLLPGRSGNTPLPYEVQSVICKGVLVFVEGKGDKTHATPYLVASRELTPMPQQIFSQHPTAADMDKLVKNLQERTFSIGSRSVTFLICGEIIAFNPDGTVKHGRKLPYDILANPVHSIMGHWNYLGKKLSTLSRRSAVLYAANNNRDHGRISTDVRIYKNGRLEGNRQIDGKVTWCECEI